VILSKRKTGKKKADMEDEQREKPKGNGIIGGTHLWGETVYAVVFWQACA